MSPPAGFSCLSSLARMFHHGVTPLSTRTKSKQILTKMNPRKSVIQLMPMMKNSLTRIIRCSGNGSFFSSDLLGIRYSWFMIRAVVQQPSRAPATWSGGHGFHSYSSFSIRGAVGDGHSTELFMPYAHQALWFVSWVPFFLMLPNYATARTVQRSSLIVNHTHPALVRAVQFLWAKAKGLRGHSKNALVNGAQCCVWVSH